MSYNNVAQLVRPAAGGTVHRNWVDPTTGGKKLRHVRRFQESIWRHAAESNLVRNPDQKSRISAFFPPEIVVRCLVSFPDG